MTNNFQTTDDPMNRYFDQLDYRRRRALRSLRHWHAIGDRKQMKGINKIIASTSIPNISDIDDRPHLTVSVAGERISGLLDSGAGISCLGKDAVNRLNRLKLVWTPSRATVNTADGAPQVILGHLKVPVSYGGKTRDIRLFIVPSL